MTHENLNDGLDSRLKKPSRERYNKTDGTQRAITSGKNGDKAARKELNRKRQRGGRETIHFSAHKKIQKKNIFEKNKRKIQLIDLRDVS